LKWGLGIGDWGLGIGDWAQSPIPNPQSPFQEKIKFIKNNYLFISIHIRIKNLEKYLNIKIFYLFFNNYQNHRHSLCFY
jgi:hypothetical protein